jgi:hypothetical protein
MVVFEFAPTICGRFTAIFEALALTFRVPLQRIFKPPVVTMFDPAADAATSRQKAIVWSVMGSWDDETAVVRFVNAEPVDTL